MTVRENKQKEVVECLVHGTERNPEALDQRVRLGEGVQCEKTGKGVGG